MEHSRSPRWMTLPYRSARNWNSMWRPPSMNFSTKDVPPPNAFSPPEARAGAPLLTHLVRRGELLHPLPAAAGGRLDEERPPYTVAEPDHLVGVLDVLDGGGDRDAGGGERLPGRD